MKPHSGSLSARIGRALKRALGALTSATRRRAFGREIVYRVAARFTPGIVVESDGRRYLMSTADHGAGMTLFMGDDVDRGTLESVFRGFDAAQKPRPQGGTFIDVGANVGTSTVTALGAFGFERAICFEPFPKNVELLRTNLNLNGLGDRAEIVEVALSDRAGSTTFEISPMNPGDARVRPEAVAGGEMGEESWPTIEVELEPLDSFVETGKIDPEHAGLLWIDAQGHEGQILSGAARFLAARRAPVVIEFWPYALKRASGLELLEQIVTDNFTSVVDLEDENSAAMPPSAIRDLSEKYWGIANTDLLLIP